MGERRKADRAIKRFLIAAVIIIPLLVGVSFAAFVQSQRQGCGVGNERALATAKIGRAVQAQAILLSARTEAADGARTLERSASRDCAQAYPYLHLPF